MQFEKMVRDHLTKYLPDLTRELRSSGTFETEVKEIAEGAREEYAALVSGGARPMSAMEIVRKEHLPEPETPE